jgi:hypothetical protein
MAGLDPGLDLQGTLFDGDPSWNMEGLMTVRVGADSTPLVSPSKIQDEVMLGADRFIIDELIDGLMADTELWIFYRQSSCD